MASTFHQPETRFKSGHIVGCRRSVRSATFKKMLAGALPLLGG